MSKKDQFTGRGPSTGNTRSHSLAATRRRWNVNLQWTTLNINGQNVRVRISTKTLRTLRKGQKKTGTTSTANKPVAKPVEEKKAVEPVAVKAEAEKGEPEKPVVEEKPAEKSEEKPATEQK